MAKGGEKGNSKKYALESKRGLLQRISVIAI
jgi:hypothetical protein